MQVNIPYMDGKGMLLTQNQLTIHEHCRGLGYAVCWHHDSSEHPMHTSWEFHGTTPTCHMVVNDPLRRPYFFLGWEGGITLTISMSTFWRVVCYVGGLELLLFWNNFRLDKFWGSWTHSDYFICNKSVVEAANQKNVDLTKIGYLDKP